MVDRISTSGTLAQNLFQLNRTQATQQLLNFRVSNQKQFQSLKNYENDAPRIVDLRQEISAREGYVRSIELAELSAGSYDRVLERLAEVAADALRAAEPTSPDAGNFDNDTAVLADNFLLEIQSNLNIRIGNRFIFSGTNFSTAPVNDIRTLGTYTTNDLASNGGTPFSPSAPNDTPTFLFDEGGADNSQSYHTSGPNTVDQDAWESLKITVNDRQTISYGITATDPAFQNLIEGVLRLKSAAQGGLTQAERKEFLDDAKRILNDAQVQLRQLQSTNGIRLNQFSDTRDLHENFINLSTVTLGEVENADPAQAAVELSALNNQLQASFSIISRQAQLTLVNFL